MVLTKEILTKEGKNYTTKDGKTKLVEHKLELGDSFIPVYNKPTLDNSGQYPKYTLKAKVKDSTGKLVIHNGSDELFLTLTNAQYDTLMNKVEAGVELNQHLFITREYENKFGKQVGVGIKGSMKEAKSFEDFENKEE